MNNKRRRLDGTPGASLASTTLPASDLSLAEHAYAQHQRCRASDGLVPPPAPATERGDITDGRSLHVHVLGNSPYPDVSSFQRPYFYRQTDPSVYNSPWPPPPSMVSFYPAAPESLDVAMGQDGHATDFTLPAASGQSLNPSAAPQSFGNEYQLASSELDSLTVHPYGNAMLSSMHVDSAPPGQVYNLEDAGLQLRMQSLSVLDNLATQMIQTITKTNYQSLQSVVNAVDTEEGQAYSTLKNLFDQTRKVYSRDTPLIDAIAIQLYQPMQQEIVRKANLATFMSNVLGAHDVSFYHLNEYFLETFVPLGHRLLKWQGAILLELKTQAYISAVLNSDGPREDMLDELFPSDLDAQILSRHPDAASLSPSEQDFVDRSRARKSYLLAEPNTAESKQELPKKYQWVDFVREFAASIVKNAESILSLTPRAHTASNTNGATAARTPASGISTVTPFLDRTAQQSWSPSRPTKAAPEASTTSETSGVTKKSTAPTATIRQPWTKAEEDALLTGLEQIGGPHWSQILAMYGRGGSVSEVLKDRNQVQLKDKARNLKLWYLKMGKEVPLALQGVTGELRKRGGARARAVSQNNDDRGDGADHGGDAV